MILSFAACTRQSESDTQNENDTQEEQSEESQETQQPVENQTEPNSSVTEQDSDSDSAQQREEPSEEENYTNEKEVTEEESTEEESTEEGPSEEELIELFEQAMNKILSLATNPTDDVLFFDIFNRDIERDYSNPITIDGFPYGWNLENLISSRFFDSLSVSS